MKRMILVLLATVFMAGACMTCGSAQQDPVEGLLHTLSLRDKITQMMMMSFSHWGANPTDETDEVEKEAVTVLNDVIRSVVKDYHFGAVILFADNLEDTRQSLELMLDLQNAAVSGGGLPMFISADQEGGTIYRLSTGTPTPGNMALAATGRMEYAEFGGMIIGSELSVLGINTALAPVVDVNNNAVNPIIGLRSYGDDPDVVGKMASAAIAGMKKYDVVGCAKHFPGHGDTAVDSHYGLPVVNKSLEELYACELKPFQIAIDQGIDMIMTAHILYPQLEQEKVISQKTGQEESLPATMSHRIITMLLKGEMGFEGVVITDAMRMAGIADYWDPVQAVVMAIQAGADMICIPCEVECVEDIGQLEAIVAGVEQAVEEGVIPAERIDDAVRRILTIKHNRGILDWEAEDFSLDRALEVVGCDVNRHIERQMAAEAVTVVQNRNNTLPLTITPDSRVLMLVPYNNEQGQMILGWNRAAEAGLISQGAQVRVVRFSRDSTLQTHLEDIDWADTLIFNSEISNASQMSGGSWLSAFILDVLDHAEKAGKTTVVQSVDKPYDVQSYPQADAVLAVYGAKGSSVDPTAALVGSTTRTKEAFGPNIVAGIEVILGVFGAQGSLPVDIPKYENGAYTEEILYPRGYGLYYDSLLAEPVLPGIIELVEDLAPGTRP